MVQRCKSGVESRQWVNARGIRTKRVRKKQAVHVLLMMTRAPSLPNTPLSLALGLLSRPFLRLRNPSMPDGFSVWAFCTSAELWLAISVHEPVSLRTTCTPPPMLVLRWEPRWRLFMGRENEGVGTSEPSVGKKSACSPRCDVGELLFAVCCSTLVGRGGLPLGDCVDHAVVVERVGCRSVS